MSNNEILLLIINSNDINKAISKLAPKTYLNDFKQALYLQVMSLPNKKLNDAISNNYLNYLIVKIIKNQAGNKSHFHKEYHNFGLPKSHTYHHLNENINILDDEPYQEDNYEKQLQIVDEFLSHQHWYHAALFRLHLSGMTYKQIANDIGIGYQSVRISIMDTTRRLKDYINK